MSLPAHDPKSTPSAGDAEQLLDVIMTDLALPKRDAGQRRRYHAAARLRFWAPRLALALLLAAAAALLLWRFARPAAASVPDSLPPQLTADRREGGDVVIFVSDGDGTGVDWAGITVTRDGGAAWPGLTVDSETGCVRFPLPDEPVYLIVPDRGGNLLHATLTPDPAA